MQDKDGNTPAHVACQELEESEDNNITAVLSIIRSSGGNLSLADKYGRTPAHACAAGKNNRGSPKAIEFLYEVDPRSFEIRDHSNRTVQDIAEAAGSVVEVFFAKLRANQLQLQASKLAFEAIKMAHVCNKLDEQVQAMFDCADQVIHIPKGYAITSQRAICPEDAEECAVKCPNPKACPGGLYSNQHCGEGYHMESVGCSQCDIGFGRSNQDPFVCGRCAAAWQMLGCW